MRFPLIALFLKFGLMQALCTLVFRIPLLGIFILIDRHFDEYKSRFTKKENECHAIKSQIKNMQKGDIFFWYFFTLLQLYSHCVQQCYLISLQKVYEISRKVLPNDLVPSLHDTINMARLKAFGERVFYYFSTFLDLVFDLEVLSRTLSSVFNFVAIL